MAERKLYIGKSGAKQGTTLPSDSITRTFGVLGQRGSGKTNSAVVMAEEMVKGGGYVAILDPVGAHYGITRDGEAAGLSGVVIGGEHGDVPLEETGGQLVAELVIGRHWPVVVIDLKLLRKGAQLRFMADFLEALFHGNRAALHVIFEEADRALPQSPRGMDPTMGRVLGAGEDIVKLGRSRGLGATLVTQRPATVNKNVLEQVECLIVHRLIGPNDRKAIKSWIEANGDPRQTDRVMDSIAGMPRGEAWVYDPGLGMLERARVRGRRTYDSSATPKVGERAPDEAPRAPVDIERLRARMAETVERAKANDPRELHKRIAELEREVDAARVEAPEPEKVLVPDREALVELTELIVDLEALRDDAREEASRAIAGWATIEARIMEALEVLGTAGSRLEAVRDFAAAPAKRPELPPRPREAPRDLGVVGNGTTAALPKAQRAILTVLVQYGARTRKQVAMLTGYAVNGGGFANALGALRSADYITRGEPIEATPQGASALGAVEALPRGPELLEHFKRQQGKAGRLMLDVLADRYPDGLSKVELAELTGYEPSGGGFSNALGRLRSLELAVGGADHIRLGQELAQAIF